MSILAIDQGTTNTKAVLIDDAGAVLASSSVPVGIEFPRPGWAQSDARDIEASVRQAIAVCLDAADAGSVTAVGISNQRESVVAWDRASGEPLGPVVSWQCNRGAELCARRTDGSTSAMVRARTGLALDPMFSASKMAWLLDAIPDGRARATGGELCLGTVDTWLLWTLTAGRQFATDETNASRTLLFDLRRRAWDDDLLTLFGIPRAALADVRPSAADYGPAVINHRACSRAGAIVGSIIGDSHAALVGHGVFTSGAIKASFGTGTSVIAPVDELCESNALSSTIGWSRMNEAVYALEGNIYATGAALEWTAHLLGLLGDVAALAELAATVPDAGGVVFVPAIAGLGAPHWDAAARGTITGLTRHAGPAQVARAAFESVAHQVADVTDAIAATLGGLPGPIHVDGGAMRSDLLAGLVADLTGTTLLRAADIELSARGAAMLAGLTTGVWRDLDELGALAPPTITVVPTMTDARRAECRAQWADGLRRTLTATTTNEPGCRAGGAS